MIGCLKRSVRRLTSAPNTDPSNNTLRVSLSSRTWNVTPNWCTLCKEPFNSWNDHRGKRDHICLAAVFEEVQKQSTHWFPCEVVADGCRRWSWLGSTDAAAVAALIGDCQRSVDRSCELARRQEIFALLQYLVSRRMIKAHHSLSNAVESAFAQRDGGMVLFKELHRPIMKLFPQSDQKDLSGLTQMVASNYNLETSFELCGMQKLLPNPLEELTYNGKGAVVRSILGQLRWVLEPDSTIPPSQIDALIRNEPHLVTVGELVARLLIAEIVVAKVTEYVCRVEAVVRELPDNRAASSSVSQMAMPQCSNFEGMKDLMFHKLVTNNR